MTYDARLALCTQRSAQIDPACFMPWQCGGRPTLPTLPGVWRGEGTEGVEWMSRPFLPLHRTHTRPGGSASAPLMHKRGRRPGAVFGRTHWTLLAWHESCMSHRARNTARPPHTGPTCRRSSYCTRSKLVPPSGGGGGWSRCTGRRIAAVGRHHGRVTLCADEHVHDAHVLFGREIKLRTSLSTPYLHCIGQQVATRAYRLYICVIDACVLRRSTSSGTTR